MKIHLDNGNVVFRPAIIKTYFSALMKTSCIIVNKRITIYFVYVLVICQFIRHIYILFLTKMWHHLRMEPCHISCNTKEQIFSESVLQNQLNSKTYRKYGVTGHFIAPRSRIVTILKKAVYTNWIFKNASTRNIIVSSRNNE